MDIERFNTIVLTKDEFGDSLYTKLGELLDILFTSGHVCVVREEETGIIRIDFNYDMYKEFGNPVPIWCSEEELDFLLENDIKVL